MSHDAEPTELPKLFIQERMKAATPRITGDLLAERMGTTPATISRLLNGRRKMTLEWLYAFSKALNAPIASLFAPPSEEPSASSPEVQLRSALLALGVDRRELDRVVDVAKTFTRRPAEERLEQTPPDDQSQPASPRRESTPSRRQLQRSTS